jgi:hypothetical protein
MMEREDYLLRYLELLIKAERNDVVSQKRIHKVCAELEILLGIEKAAN